MRVALEVTAGGRGGRDRGIGRYLEAVRAANALAGNEVVEVHSPMGDRRLSEVSGLVRRSASLAARPFDVFHAPTTYYPAILWPGRAQVVSILDVIPLDVRGHRRTGLKAQLFHRLGARAGAILTLSDHTAGRLVDLLGVAPERVVVAPLPPSPGLVAPEVTDAVVPDDRRPYVVAMVDLRTHDPRKRAEWLPKIARHLGPRGIDTVVAGAGTERWDVDGLVARGRVSDPEWAALLRGAELLVYTSSYEGQGMPVLEALACGTPVVAMRNSALPEVVGDAGILLEEDDDAEGPRRIAEEVVRLLGDPGALASLRSRCAAQAGRFTAARFSEAVSRAYALATEQTR